MRTLILMRHATAVEFHQAPSDYTRDLSVVGRAQAQQQALHLSQHYCPEYIIASGALRTSMTAAYIANTFMLPIHLHLKPELHLAHAEQYSDAIKAIPDTVYCAMLIGHNPNISALVTLLSGHQAEPLAPAGIALLQTPADWTAGTFTFLRQM